MDTVPMGSGMCVRPAQPDDVLDVARILSQAFPTLYKMTFGNMSRPEIASLLALLYRSDHLSLATTLLCEREGEIIGVEIMHLGQSIGKGKIPDYGRLVLGHLGARRAPRAFLGGVFANFMLDHRIPSAPDLSYIEALAVDEKARGQGAGTLLLRTAIAWSIERGRKRMALHVLTRNHGARRLYERCGFSHWESENRLARSLRRIVPPSPSEPMLMVRLL